MGFPALHLLARICRAAPEMAGHFRNAQVILLDGYYYVVDWAGRQSYPPHTPFMTDPANPYDSIVLSNFVEPFLRGKKRVRLIGKSIESKCIRHV
jgi:hypothetical protein